MVILLVVITLGGALATMAGADVITKDVIKKTSPINPEFILEKNPDIIMIMGSYWPKKPTFYDV